MAIAILKAIALGAVEGLTEFLPVSSTGHLLLVNQWIRFGPTFTTLFDIVIQLGAILAVILYFWDRIWPFGKNQDKKRTIYSVWSKTLIGVLPALVLGGLLGGWIEEQLFNPSVVAAALVVGGFLLILIEKRQITHRFDSITRIPWQIALYIGLFQCLSLIPGTSRAAATIIGALLLGASRTVAVEFSFFLAIPTLIAAGGYSILKHGAAMTGSETVLLALGFSTAFLVAWAVIARLMRYIRDHDFRIFGYYRIALGTLVLLYFVSH